MYGGTLICAPVAFRALCSGHGCTCTFRACDWLDLSMLAARLSGKLFHAAWHME